MATSASTRGLVSRIIWPFCILFIIKSSQEYEIVVENESKSVIFDASLPDRGRMYEIVRLERTPSWINRLFSIDQKSGLLILKQCVTGGFQIMVTSRTHRINSEHVTTISIPIFISLRCQNNEAKINDPLRTTTADVIVSGDHPHAEYVCYKRSQVVFSINETIPRTVREKCNIKYQVPDDDLVFNVEKSSGDLVIVKDECFHNEWTVNVPYQIMCGKRTPSKHSVLFHFKLRNMKQNEVVYPKIVYHKHRVKRQSSERIGGNRPPHFDKPTYSVSVPEEKDKGYVVTTLRAEDPEDDEVEYTMLALLDARSQNMFKMDETSGVISTKTKLDREFMDMHYFRIIAVDNGIPSRTATATIQILVQDHNDHPPKFEQNIYQESIRESVPIGSVVVTVRATDRDIGDNSVISYTILNPTGANEAFVMDKNSGILTTQRRLDREQNVLYSLTVQATDQTKSLADQKSTTAVVEVTILDDNDNYPQFTERTYTVHVAEDINWINNPVVAKVKAMDDDFGSNAAVRYTLIGGNTQGHFTMDGLTGKISVVAPLDYENFRSYRLVVRAQDGGSPARSNTTQVLVNVIDVNDNDPRFYTSMFQESIMENTGKDHGIVQVQAFDSDDGQNGEIKYAIKEAPDNMPIVIDPMTGWISSSRKLDHEEGSVYRFSVVASDQGKPQRSASASVIITVQDVNDNDPQFEPKVYHANIAEDSSPGSPVISVTASDPDQNSRIFYQITSGNERGRFNVISQNKKGLISLARPLDYKQEKRYVIMVTATDSGGRFDTATVYVNVTDANTHRPMFVQTPYSTSIAEDAIQGAPVLTVEATDGDVGENARITYTIDDDSSKVFRIDPTAGAISIVSVLDRERIPGYTISVTAQDNGNPPLSDTTDVEVVVSDVNDNSPIFSKSSYMSSVPENVAPGASVVHVTASDADQGLNGRVRYTFDGGYSGDGAFTIDPVSGIIRTSKELDRETVALYKLIAFAVDRGQPGTSTSVTIQVTVEDKNDNPPRFESGRIKMFIPENSPVGSTVGNIRAYDPDDGPNAVVKYSVVGGDDANAFKLTARPDGSVEVTTLVDVDYESKKKRYKFDVRAESPPMLSEAKVEIWVTDVNDNAPTLNHFNIVFNNFKNFFPVGPIGRVPAHDDDVTDKLQYRFLSGNNAKFLLLNESTGEISLSPGLNTNVPIDAEMEVNVFDGINEVVKHCKLKVRYVTDEMLFNSVTVRLNQMTEEAFLSRLYDYFIDGLRAVFPVLESSIFVFNIQDDTDVDAQILNVSFSIRDPTIYNQDVFYSPQYLKEKVYLNRQTFADWARVEILPFDDNLCVREPCPDFIQCLSVLKFGNASSFISSDTMFFRPIYPVNTFACQCPKGFAGMDENYECNIEVNLCYSNPCGANGTCLQNEGGYTCKCEAGYTGKQCEISLQDGKCSSDICHSGSVCNRTPLKGLYCDNCSISSSYMNKFCQLTARSFSQNTFLTFPSLKQRHRFQFKLSFATRNRNGLLLYNGRYNEKHDFISLEIIDSKIIFSYSVGGNISTVSASVEGGLSDGQWHRVKVTYFNRTATISLDDCDTAIAIKYGKRLGNYLCANTTTLKLENRCTSSKATCYRHLDLTGPLQIGGLPLLSMNHYRISQTSFVGCIKDVYIDYVLLDLNRPIQDNGTDPGCYEKENFCRSSPCYNGGSCVNGWGSYMCHCTTGFVGKNCSIRVDEARHFHGDGFMSFNPSLRPINLPWNVSFSFRTRKRDGLLLKLNIGSNNLAIFQMIDGFIHYSYKNEKIIMDSVPVDDGIWHNIQIKWMTVGIWSSLDYNQYEVTKIMKNSPQSQYVGKVSVGGVEDEKTDLKYFKGCIQDVQIGGVRNVWLHPSVERNVGHGCVIQDPCESNPCPMNSWCIDKWDSYVCQCEPGHIGDQCVSICKLDPCYGGSTCRSMSKNSRHGYSLITRDDQWSQESYWCECDEMYTGRYCEVSVGQQPCPTNWWGYPVCGPCECNVDKGYDSKCNKTTGECYCKDSHYQPPGQTGECLPCDCYTVGSYGNRCSPVTGQCRCRDDVIGRKCDLCSNPLAEITPSGCRVVYDRCPTAFSNGIWWKSDKFDSLINQSCPDGSVGIATRYCDKTGEWQDPDLFNCTSNAFIPLQRPLNQLEAGQVKVINVFVAKSLSHELQEAVNVTMTVQKHLYGNDIMIISRLLHFLLKYEQTQAGLNLTHRQDKDFIKCIVEAASAVLDPRYKSAWDIIRERIDYGVEELLDSFEGYSTILVNSRADTFTDPFQITSANMVFGLDTVSQSQLWLLEGSDVKKSRYLSDDPVPSVYLPKYNNIEMDNDDKKLKVRAKIPLSIMGISEPNGKVDKNTAVFAYSIFPTIGQLMPRSYASNVRRRYGIKTSVSSSVFTLTVQAVSKNFTLHGQTLEHNVEMSFEIGSLVNRVSPQCVYWHTAKKEWTTQGCRLVGELFVDDRITCSCNHMTSFAVVMDVTDIKYFVQESMAQFMTSYLGFILSLILLLLTFVILCSLRGLQTNSNTIHKNLIFCLFMVELVFLVAIKLRETLTLHEFPCKVVAILLHYFYVSVFSWLFVESIHLYRMFIELRDINHGQMRFYYSLGYGVTAIIVGLAVGVRADEYGNYFFCWLSIYQNAIWSLVGPICFFIVVTLATLALAVIASIQIKDTVTDFGNLRTLLWLGIGLLPLTGVTWVVMLLSVNEMKPLLGYFSSICCLLQSIYIFLGYCFLNHKVRQQLKYAWMRLKGEKVPYDVSLSGTRTTISSRSALAYNSPFDVLHRNVGISTSSTTSRSTAKTSSSPYRSDFGESVMRVTNTSTSTSGRFNSMSDLVNIHSRKKNGTEDADGRRKKSRNMSGETESDSEISVGHASLDLASSHSSDDEDYDNAVNWNKQNKQNNVPDIISQSPYKSSNADHANYQSISPPYAVPLSGGMNLPATSPSPNICTSPAPLHPLPYTKPQWSVPTQMPVSMSAALQRQQKLNGYSPLGFTNGTGFNWLSDPNTTRSERPTSLNITEGLEEYASRPGGGESQYSPRVADESPGQLPMSPPEREDSLPPPPASISDDYNNSSHTSSPTLNLPSHINKPMSIPPITTAEISDGSEDSNETCV